MPVAHTICKINARYNYYSTANTKNQDICINLSKNIIQQTNIVLVCVLRKISTHKTRRRKDIGMDKSGKNANICMQNRGKISDKARNKAKTALENEHPGDGICAVLEGFLVTTRIKNAYHANAGDCPLTTRELESRGEPSARRRLLWSL